jgi:ureidoglycolate dehydrogenase (NAD+)
MGAVAVKNSTHFASAAYYALRAAERDHIGFAFTNANDMVIAANALKPFFGTNPVCVAAPMHGEAPFCLDMATSAFSVNRLKNYRRVQKPLPEGMAFDTEGQPTTDAAKACFVGPVGGYKGFGLGMMVELLCGLLTGGPTATEITPIYASLSARRRLSHFFMALDIARFSDAALFKTRLRDMAAAIRSLPRADAAVPVMIPGDPEKNTFRIRIREGIPVDEPKFAEYMAVNPDFAEALTPESS